MLFVIVWVTLVFLRKNLTRSNWSNSILQCSGSMTFWYGSGSRAPYSRIRIRIQILLPKFFCLFITVGTLTSVFKSNMSLRSHKTVEIMVYLNLFAGWWIWIRILEAQKHTDPSGSESLSGTLPFWCVWVFRIHGYLASLFKPPTGCHHGVFGRQGSSHCWLRHDLVESRLIDWSQKRQLKCSIQRSGCATL